MTGPTELAPLGWHIASKEEWSNLVEQLGGEKAAGKKLRSSFGWDSYTTGGSKTCPHCQNWNAEYRSKKGCDVCKDRRYVPAPTYTHQRNGSNSSGFSALPGGYFSASRFYAIKSDATYWTNTIERKRQTSWSDEFTWVTTVNLCFTLYDEGSVYFSPNGQGPSELHYIRCVKNDISGHELSKNSENELGSKNEFKTEITDCDWKPSEGMYFRCNDSNECDTEAGNIFRDYVHREFPEVAKKYNLNKTGVNTLDYCNSAMKKVWEHKYDGEDYPGLKGETIGVIFQDHLIPQAFRIECQPWETNNYFINDYITDAERDKEAFKMLVSFNDKFTSLLDSRMLDLCDIYKKVDNDLDWARKNNKKDLHKNPIIKWIANSEMSKGIKYYDEWKKTKNN
jgi:hypothetical protein